METKTIFCPRCKKQTVYSQENPDRPFCSERCRLIDLGEWADEKYRVPTSDAPSSDHGPEDPTDSGSQDYLH